MLQCILLQNTKEVIRASLYFRAFVETWYLNSETPKTGNLSVGYFCNNYLLSAFSSSNSFPRDVIKLKYTINIQQNELS